MDKRRLEQITEDYWSVSTAVRHPSAPAMACGDALQKILSSDRLRPDEWMLNELTHTLRYDIIEGNNRWRDKPRGHGSVLTLPMKG